MKAELYTILNGILPRRMLQYMVLAYQRSSGLLLRGDPWFFRSVVIETGTACNRRCYYCPQSGVHAPNLKMTDELFRLALFRLAEVKWAGMVDYVMFNEATLDPRLVQLVRMTKSALPGCVPRIVSNGDFLTDQLTHDLIWAGAAKFLVTRHDLDEVDWQQRIVPLAAKYPGYFTLDVLHNSPLLNNRGGQVPHWRKLGIKPLTKCHCPEGLVISYQGNLLLCCCDYNHITNFGSIREHGLLELWNQPEFRAIRQGLRQGTPSKYSICRGCFGLEPEPDLTGRGSVAELPVHIGLAAGATADS